MYVDMLWLRKDIDIYLRHNVRDANVDVVRAGLLNNRTLLEASSYSQSYAQTEEG